jgi:hypothetical protein
MLIEIFCCNPVVADRGFAGEGDVALEYLMSSAANSDVGAIAVEASIPLRRSRLLLKGPVAVIAWALIGT